MEGKSVRLTNEQKAEIAVYADHNAQFSREDLISWVVKNYDLDGVPAQALISTLRKSEKVKWAKEYLMQETAAHKMKSKSTHQSEYTELEKKLFSWFSHLESGQAVVIAKLIREKALVFAEELKHSEFKASPNWLILFKKLHNIKQYVLNGEAGSADKVYVDVGKAELPLILSGTDLDDIFNADGTALLFRQIPSRTLATHK